MKSREHTCSTKPILHLQKEGEYEQRSFCLWLESLHAILLAVCTNLVVRLFDQFPKDLGVALSRRAI